MVRIMHLIGQLIGYSFMGENNMTTKVFIKNANEEGYDKAVKIESFGKTRKDEATLNPGEETEIYVWDDKSLVITETNLKKEIPENGPVID
jgi:hypothetical protein